MGGGSGIRKKPIPDPGSRGQKGTGSRIWIRNTAIQQQGFSDGLGLDPVRDLNLDGSENFYAWLRIRILTGL